MEAGELEVQGQLRLHMKFKANLEYLETLSKEAQEERNKVFHEKEPLPYLVQGRDITGVLSASLPLSRACCGEVLLGLASH